MSWKADCHKSWLSLKAVRHEKLIVTKADCHKGWLSQKAERHEKLIVTKADCHRSWLSQKAECHWSWLSQKLIVTKADCHKSWLSEAECQEAECHEVECHSALGTVVEIFKVCLVIASIPSYADVVRYWYWCWDTRCLKSAWLSGVSSDADAVRHWCWLMRLYEDWFVFSCPQSYLTITVLRRLLRLKRVSR